VGTEVAGAVHTAGYYLNLNHANSCEVCYKSWTVTGSYGLSRGSYRRSASDRESSDLRAVIFFADLKRKVFV
jgi:hypothetical protein